MPGDRPIFYGLFLYFASLGLSVWIAVFVQNVILSFVLNRFIKLLFPAIPFAHLVLFYLFCSLLTIGGWYASQMMPDIFVAILALSIVNFLLDNKGSKLLPIAHYLIILFSGLVHNAHFFVLGGVSAVLLVALVRKVEFITFKKWVSLAIAGVACWVLICTKNTISGNGFVTSKYSYVFLMGKMCENGVLKDYLSRKCNDKHYELCSQKDALPVYGWDFVWGGDMPHNKSGNWDLYRREYESILNQIFSNPKYLLLLMCKSVETTARQLTLLTIDKSYEGEQPLVGANSPAYFAIAEYFPHELGLLETSRQNTKDYNIPFLNGLFVGILLLSSFVALFIHGFSKGTYSSKFFIMVIVVLSAIVFNAFVTANIANVLTRLNARIMWLIPFLAVIYLYHRLVYGRLRL